jgi:hypothetical protein
MTYMRQLLNPRSHHRYLSVSQSLAVTLVHSSNQIVHHQTGGNHYDIESCREVDDISKRQSSRVYVEKVRKTLMGEEETARDSGKLHMHRTAYQWVPRV